MKCSEVIRVLYNAGFTDGISNVRRKTCNGYRFLAAFSDIDTIKELYFSIQLGNSLESYCSLIIPTNSYEQLEKVIDEISERLDKEIEKFNESVKSSLDKLKANGNIKSWK